MKDFITFEQALALKGLGFNEPCFGFYIETGEWTPASYSREGTVYPSNSDLLPEWVASPTYSQAFRFFRDEHNMSHEIFKNEKVMIDYVASKGETHLPKYRFGYTDDAYHTVGTCMEYEEAETKCLDKLIEVVKSMGA